MATVSALTTGLHEAKEELHKVRRHDDRQSLELGLQLQQLQTQLDAAYEDVAVRRKPSLPSTDRVFVCFVCFFFVATRSSPKLQPGAAALLFAPWNHRPRPQRRRARSSTKNFNSLFVFFFGVWQRLKKTSEVSANKQPTYYAKQRPRSWRAADVNDDDDDVLIDDDVIDDVIVVETQDDELTLRLIANVNGDRDPNANGTG